MTVETVEKEIVRDYSKNIDKQKANNKFEENKNKQFKNSLSHLAPAKLLPVLVARSGIAEEKKVNEITREERHQLVRAVNDVMPDADKILRAFKVKGVSQDYTGTRVLLGGELAGIQPSIANMTNVSEFAQTQNGDIVMYFSGKYATFTLVNGAKVTFVLENPATGIKSEQEELYQGIFFKGAYHKRRAAGRR